MHQPSFLSVKRKAKSKNKAVSDVMTVEEIKWDNVLTVDTGGEALDRMLEKSF